MRRDGSLFYLGPESAVSVMPLSPDLMLFLSANEYSIDKGQDAPGEVVCAVQCESTGRMTPKE